MSCADVCIDHDFDGSTSFVVKKIVKARVGSHRCCECGDHIVAGQKYERQSGKTDGQFWSVATCAECAEIRDTFVCRSYVIGALWESVREEMFPIWRTPGPIDCLAKLTTDTARTRCNKEFTHWIEDDA